MHYTLHYNCIVPQIPKYYGMHYTLIVPKEK